MLERLRELRELRHSRWAGRRQWRRLSLWGEFAGYALPLPSMGLDFQQCTVSMNVSLGTGGWTDPVASLALELELPGYLADGLVLIWPGIERRDRRDAWQRLRTGYSFQPDPPSDATPTPTIREDP